MHRLYIYKLNKSMFSFFFYPRIQGFTEFDRFSEHYWYSISRKYNINIQPSILLILVTVHYFKLLKNVSIFPQAVSQYIKNLVLKISLSFLFHGLSSYILDKKNNTGVALYIKYVRWAKSNTIRINFIYSFLFCY